MQTPLSTQQIDEKILLLKQQLQALGPLHPGSLSRQYQVCGKPGCKCCDPKKPRPHGPYAKLTYVYHGKFTCRFVRAESVREVTALVATFKIFRQLTDAWIALAVQRAQLGPLQRSVPASKKAKVSPQTQKTSRGAIKGR
jgi:hypothetical protein